MQHGCNSAEILIFLNVLFGLNQACGIDSSTVEKIHNSKKFFTVEGSFWKWHVFFDKRCKAGVFPELKINFMIELKEKHCVPCEEGTEPLIPSQAESLMKKLNTKWKVVDNKMLRKEFPFENFKRGMAFAQNVALIADKEDHHPDMCIHYNLVEIELTTHSIGGLSENDFIMAAKIDEL